VDILLVEGFETAYFNDDPLGGALQYRIRQSLEKADKSLPEQKGKPTKFMLHLMLA
jgi:hypothetical protein